MTYETERQALRAGRALRSKIKVLAAQKLEVRVYENLGWHCSVDHPSLQVWETDLHRYSALPKPSYCVWCDTTHSYSSPDAAILGTVEAMRKHVRHLARILYKAERGLRL